ncbi:MAG TPA: hypothetical protein DEG74_00635 [Clostridiales bacterium]|nr:hypothetical protein [Clostridiales bacterium]HBY32260.1 hypothetical protein [Clostridiales bacterium]
MKVGKLLTTILAVSLALPMCACKPKSKDESKEPSSESSTEATSSESVTDTEPSTETSGPTEPTSGPTVPSAVTDESEDPLVIYGYEEDFSKEFADYLKDIDYEYIYVAPDQYVQELKSAFASEKKPDLFMMNAEALTNFTDSDYSIGIEQVGISSSDLSDQFEYTYKAAMTKDHSIKALAYDLSPTALIYNRKLADKYLGSAEPSQVTAKLSDWNSFMEQAREVSMNTEGAIKLLADRRQLGRLFWAGRNASWVKDGKVTVDADFDNFFSLQEKLFNDTLTLEFDEGSEEWTRAINDGQCVLFFGSLNKASKVIGYVPGHEEKEPDQSETTATGETSETTKPEETGWSIVPAPTASYDGGTWLMVASSCDRKATAAKVLKILTMDQTVMTDMAVKGRFVNSRTIMQKCAQDPNFASDFLAGQNPYVVLVAEAERIVIPDDQTVQKCAENEIHKLFDAYISGEIETMDEVKQQFIIGMEELLGLS